MKASHAALCAGLSFCAALTGATAYADAGDDAVQARRGYFRMLGVELGPLGAMAKGEIDYDTAVAQANADDIAALAGYSVGDLFLEGTAQADRVGDTRALPAIWTDMADFQAKTKDFVAAAAALKEAAGQGREALGPAVGRMGQTCGACHDAYRAKEF
jgi:cytochrome c556